MTLSVDLEGDTALICRRRFAASPEKVYAAHIDPDIVKQWMTGPDGWSMPVCEIDARPGGTARYEWSDGETSFGLTATFESLEPPHRIVHEEHWGGTEGMPSNRIETVFEPDGGGTLMTMRIEYPDAETREQALKSGMVEGMEMSYARIDDVA